jgi:acetyl-CoA carboxylase biotin carboxyl carrier protein
VKPNEIRELIELISRSSFKTFELEREGFRLRLVKADAVASGAPVPAATAPAISVETAPEAAAAETAPPVEPGLYEVNSPIVGTFYAAPSPEAPPYVEVGSRVRKGQVLCIVEAMKVMNEIESEVDGELVEILVKNGQPVEFGEVMFRLRPS